MKQPRMVSGQHFNKATPTLRRLTAGLLGAVCLVTLSGCQQHALPQAKTAIYAKAGPSEVNILTIGAQLSTLAFEDADGDPFTLAENTQGPMVMLYWASWCPSCKEALKHVDDLATLVADNGGTLLLVNKLDGVKETKEQALAWLSDNGIATQTVFDRDAAQYTALHLAYVPTLLVTDAGGILTSFASGGVPKEAALLSMLKEAKAGKSARMASVVAGVLTGVDGGIHTSNVPEGAQSPTGDDVLSESQGLMMLYAARKGDMALFDSAWTYVQAHLTTGGLAQWYASNEGKPTAVNATLDDLRIYHALHETGNHTNEAAAYAKALLQYAVQDKKLVDFYDFQSRKSAGTLTLCYADFATLQLLAGQDASWQPVLDNALAVVTNGMISESFPLYHAKYDYAQGTYHSDTLHMAEALLTLLNLAEVDLLPPESYAWLRARLLEDGHLYAYYRPDGSVASDGLYESSAVYAVAAQIALQQNDLPLARAALTKLEALRIRDAKNPLDGALGEANGTGIHSFDQLKALLAYQMMETAIKGGEV